MSRGAKVFLIVTLTIFALFTTTLTFAAVAIYRQGSIGVAVHEKGPGGANIGLSVPAFLVTGVIHFVPDSVMLPPEAAVEIEPFIPTMLAASEALEECPDAVFVRVTSKSENVLIAKKDGHFIVQVRSDDADVDVRIPIRAADSVIAKLARAARNA